MTRWPEGTSDTRVNRGIRLGQLQRRHRQTVSVRERRLGDQGPVRIVAEKTRGLAGKPARGQLTYAKTLQHRPQVVRLQREGNLGGADVAGFGEYRRERNVAQVARILDHLGAHLDKTG